MVVTLAVQLHAGLVVAAQRLRKVAAAVVVVRQLSEVVRRGLGNGLGQEVHLFDNNSLAVTDTWVQVLNKISP